MSVEVSISISQYLGAMKSHRTIRDCVVVVLNLHRFVKRNSLGSKSPLADVSLSWPTHSVQLSLTSARGRFAYPGALCTFLECQNLGKLEERIILLLSCNCVSFSGAESLRIDLRMCRTHGLVSAKE